MKNIRIGCVSGLSCFFLTLSLVSTSVVAQKPDLRIGLLEDGPWERDQQVRSTVEQAIESGVGPVRDVFFPEEKRLQGNWKLDGVRSALDRLLADPEVDLIVTLGILGSYEAATRQFLAKPVIAARVVAPDLLHIPSQPVEGKQASGVPNLSYVTVMNTPLKGAVALFRDLVGFDRVTFLVMDPARQLYPDLRDAVATVLGDLQLEQIDMIFIQDDVGKILRRISPDTQAVVLTAQPQLPPGEFRKLLDFLMETNLPSFTLGPKEDLAAGVLFGLDTKAEVELIAQTVGRNVRAIVDGKDAGSLPVQLGVEESLLFNGAVAAAIGFDLEKALKERQARAADMAASSTGPSMNPVTDETADLSLRRGGPQLTAEELQKRQMAVIQKVQQELARMSSYSAFDSISFRVEGTGKVTLLGYSLDSSAKNEAERRVQRIEDVEEVVNLIEVLPNSGNDDSIRARAYAAIYGHPSMRRYVPGAGWSSMDVRNFLRDLEYGIRAAQITKGPHAIHILVKNGHLALVGSVASEMDKQIAEVQVRSLPGVFSVQNHLQVGS